MNHGKQTTGVELETSLPKKKVFKIESKIQVSQVKSRRNVAAREHSERAIKTQKEPKAFMYR